MRARKVRLADWPARMAAVEAERSDDALQRLCAVLDVADADVCRRWDEPGHDQRRARLASMRAEARRANRLVSEAQRVGRSARVAKGNATRAAREADRPAVAGLAVVGGAAAR